MTWIKFAVWIAGLYTTYYAAIVLWDILRNSRSSNSKEAGELTFTGDLEPEQLQAVAISAEGIASAIVSSGGVSLKQMFNLAREEAIEYIRPVSF